MAGQLGKLLGPGISDRACHTESDERGDFPDPIARGLKINQRRIQIAALGGLFGGDDVTECQQLFARRRARTQDHPQCRQLAGKAVSIDTVDVPGGEVERHLRMIKQQLRSRMGSGCLFFQERNYTLVEHDGCHHLRQMIRIRNTHDFGTGNARSRRFRNFAHRW
jgi:hypothetical protein